MGRTNAPTPGRASLATYSWGHVSVACAHVAHLRRGRLQLAVVGHADPVVDALVQAFATNQMGCKPWPLTVPLKPVTER